MDALVKTDPAGASHYINHLSKVYRYVLDHEEREVVGLQGELDFIQHYIARSGAGLTSKGGSPPRCG